MTAVRVTAQIALFGAALADSQQTEAGAHIGGGVRGVLDEADSQRRAARDQVIVRVTPEYDPAAAGILAIVLVAVPQVPLPSGTGPA